MNDKNRNLYYLEELSDYKVADSDKDARGWEVKDKNNKVLGKVDNFVVNKKTEKVVYMDVEVDASIIKANAEPYRRSDASNAKKFVNEEGENHLILPVGMVRLDTDDEYVITDTIDYQTFSQTKRIRKGQPIQRDYEVVVLDSYTRNDDNVSYRDHDDNDDAFYANERFQRSN